jgi:hypothetical protein
MGPRADLKDVEKRKFLTLPVFELRSFSPLARSQSLYRLRYPGSLFITIPFLNHLFSLETPYSP